MSIKTVKDLKEWIKEVPDDYKLLFSVDPTDDKTEEKDYDKRYQSKEIPEMSVQDGRLIFHLYDMDKNF